MPNLFQHVAIVGGGFSGTLLAINLVRYEGPRVTLIERAAAPGGGVAYGSAHPELLLNVRAGNMSAFPDDADHFVRWLAARGLSGAAASFVPRLTYGVYLRELLQTAVAGAAGRLAVVRGDVDALDLHDDGRRAIAVLREGSSIETDAAVLAVGNLPPHAPPGFDAAPGPPWYSPDPWATDLGADLGDAAVILLVGTGLTMIDVVLTLEARGFAGRIIALSRRGLAPARHAPPTAPLDRVRAPPAGGVSALLRHVRRRGDEVGWRSAVDELRPFTQVMWAQAAQDERARFLRHLRPWWDVHRHRLAPAVADRIDRLRRDGRLTLIAGRTVGCERRGDRLAVGWRPRGEEETQILEVDRVVNCTGPLGDLTRTTEPLLAGLAAAGSIAPDTLRLGIAVDPGGRAIAADGGIDPRLLVLGPMTRGAFWEIVAVPDIRRRAWDLARRLSHADWVGGEGL